ncbi:hypothetical protein K432DRAFT_463390 [Lepidopterella palustris CBS 459.81]|uniref:RING-type E3 ubiquitin transferase n=1 Tax=Lepidopterella palustris CBS 459.81 TaxID=1314670 RepID=A0A8E2E2V0_9PEZI|nr:hypothetical protein K432DRAFT_463390 [Lepidopterella palustris CBS 459.81]
MEHIPLRHAPGPASLEAIAALPKKKVTSEMFGSDGKAECSICMAEVNKDEEITELYCCHWFHSQCIGKWLSSHNACPHCRRAI